MMPLNIVVYETDPTIMKAFQPLSETNEVRFIDGLLSEANAGHHSDADIICMDQSVLSKPILEHFSQLKMIAVRSTGYDHIDTAFCTSRGIAVCNIPGYAANAVAEHTFALVLAISRHVDAALQYTRKTTFRWEGLQGFELQGKTMSVIGTGAIGKRVAEIALGFGMTVLAFDLKPDTVWARHYGLDYVDMETAVSSGDIISLNIPLAKGSRYLLDESWFQQMKDGVVIINTGRGELIDPKALINSLDSGKVSAAGLDVLPDEHYIREKDKRPGIYFEDHFDPRDMLANHLLCQHPNVVVTPHVGWYTIEAEQRAIDMTVENITAFAEGKSRNVVNP